MKTKKTTSRRGTRATVTRAAKIAKKRGIRRKQPAHKRFLLHPVSMMVVLCATVFIVGWTYEVVADSYAVTAAIPASPLEQGAVITDPVEGAVFTNVPVNVSGTCPPDSYVKLYRNGTFGGVALCQGSGNFIIQTDLYRGKNTLTAQAFNFTDQQGPETPSVHVIYKRPSTTAPTAKTTSTSPVSTSTADSNVAPLLLTSDFHYQAFTTGNAFEWTMNLEGGTPPYKVHIDWGDGETSNLVFDIDPAFQIKHTYKSSGYYPIKIQSKDATGTVKTMQLAALIARPGDHGIISTTGGPAQPPKPQNKLFASLHSARSWLWLAWPSLIVVLLMALSFWLGEHQELQQFKKKHGARRHLPLPRH